MEPFTVSLLWLVIVGFIIAFILAFGIGANDVANSFGTSVGSKVLTLRQACWLATVCEISGAVLIGYKVSDTVRKGILDVQMYEGSEKELMFGCVAALTSSAIWLLVATFLKLPISGTHSIVGSTIGFSLVARGFQGINWTTLGTIVASWFVSPVLSGLVSTSLFWFLRKFIISASNPLRAGLISLPIFYGLTIFVNIFSIVHDGPKLLYMDNIPTWLAVVSSIVVGLLVAIIVQLVLVPIQRRRILGIPKASKKPVTFTFGDSDEKKKKFNMRFSVLFSSTIAESSPGGSPKRGKRPLYLVCDGKQLPAITETTELVSLTNGGCSPQPKIFSDPNMTKHCDLNGFTKGNNTNGNYKIDPSIIKRAENLLGKTSLDNTDLTITSLNYIDEYQNGLSKSPPTTNILKEQEMVDLSPQKKDLLEVESVMVDPTKKNLNTVESGGSLDHMMSTTISPNSSRVPLIPGSANVEDAGRAKADEPKDISQLFSYLQILTATFGSFAHGGNDVSNAIGPLIGLYLIFKDGSALQKSETPLWLLVYGGVGIAAGLWVWGRRVIQTVGNDLTKITPTTGFTIEIGAAMTVLLASKIGLPISTTHCKVGSVVFVGYANTSNSCRTPAVDDEGRVPEKAVDWSLFRNIVYAWVITVPIAAALSAGLMYLLLVTML
ncbi:Phosphate transporter [Sergentomyia squamirostris]